MVKLKFEKSNFWLKFVLFAKKLTRLQTRQWVAVIKVLPSSLGIFALFVNHSEGIFAWNKGFIIKLSLETICKGVTYTVTAENRHQWRWNVSDRVISCYWQNSQKVWFTLIYHCFSTFFFSGRVVRPVRQCPLHTGQSNHSSLTHFYSTNLE